MQIEFYGGAGCVTGSCHLIKLKGKNILLDCGMYQGKEEKERGNENFNFNPQDIDYVILSHAHIDHSGRIPLLYKQGFKGKVLCTEGTLDLCKVMLPDSGHILESECKWKNRKRERKGLTPIDPLYTSEIAEASMCLFEGCSYDKWIEIFHGFKLIFRDAGHILGSSITEMELEESPSKKVKLVYSGDLGNKNIPILNDPTPIDSADYVILESTYGNRFHTAVKTELNDLSKIIKDTFKRGGNVIIPSFAVGRTQEILYLLNTYVEDNILKDIEVFVDSPLACESTAVFSKYHKYYDSDAKILLAKGDDPLEFPGLTFTKSAEESILLNNRTDSIIIISASGMCDAGRIKHHLKHNLWREESSIVFVGYQAEGTLGRNILNGSKNVKIFGEEIAVSAKIYNLPSLSGHADKAGLTEWLNKFKSKPKKVILVHGDLPAIESFGSSLTSLGYSIFTPKSGDSFDPDMLEQKSSTTRNKILSILDNEKDLDSMNKEDLLKKIKSAIMDI